MTIMEETPIIVGTREWDEFVLDSEIVTTFESKDGPNLVLAVIWRGTPSGAPGCTLYVSMFVQDPLPSPTIKIRPKVGDLFTRMGAPADYVDEELDVRGTFLEGVKSGDMHHSQFAEEHASIGSAVLRLAALSHANATGALLSDFDASKHLVMLEALTTEV